MNITESCINAKMNTKSTFLRLKTWHAVKKKKKKVEMFFFLEVELLLTLHGFLMRLSCETRVQLSKMSV